MKSPEQIAQEHEQKLNYIGKLDAMSSGPNKYRAIYEFALQANPSMKAHVEDVINELKMKKLELRTDTASSASGSTRHLSKYPAGLINLLYYFEPALKADMESKDRDIRKAAARKLARAFPEFTVANKI